MNLRQGPPADGLYSDGKCMINTCRLSLDVEVYVCNACHTHMLTVEINSTAITAEDQIMPNLDQNSECGVRRTTGHAIRSAIDIA